MARSRFATENTPGGADVEAPHPAARAKPRACALSMPAIFSRNDFSFSTYRYRQLVVARSVVVLDRQNGFTRRAQRDIHPRQPQIHRGVLVVNGVPKDLDGACSCSYDLRSTRPPAPHRRLPWPESTRFLDGTTRELQGQ